MIDALTGNNAAAVRPVSSNSLSPDQKSAVAQVLSGYDAKALTPETSQAILSKVKDLGVSLSAELSKAFSEAGFDARVLGDLASVTPPGHRASSIDGAGRMSLDQNLVSLMSEVAKTYQNAEGAEIDFYDVLKSKLEENGYTLSQTNIDFYV